MQAIVRRAALTQCGLRTSHVFSEEYESSSTCRFQVMVNMKLNSEKLCATIRTHGRWLREQQQFSTSTAITIGCDMHKSDIKRDILVFSCFMSPSRMTRPVVLALQKSTAVH